MKKTALVVGSGFGGIASALRLKALGYNVTLIERLRPSRRKSKGF